MKLKSIFFILIITISTSNSLFPQIKNTYPQEGLISSYVYTGMFLDGIDGVLTMIKKFPTNNVNNLIHIYAYQVGDRRFSGGGAINPSNPTNLYFISKTTPNNIFVFSLFDLETNMETPLGILDDLNWRGLAFDPTSGILYAITYNALYSIDHSTAIPTFIGTTGIVPTSLAIDGNGEMFSYDVTNDNFYHINKSTGASTYIGPLGFDVKNGAMAWDPNTDNIYLTSFNFNFTSDFRIVDKNTGASTLLGHLIGGLANRFIYYDWISFDGSNLGLNDFNSMSFEFFPNPASNVINYISSLNLKLITIFDLSGKTVIEITNPVSGQINISKLKTGMYFMKVESQDKLFSYKIIKE